MEIPENKLQAIREAIHAGPEHKITAIKLVREATGCGLAEAKEFVEKSAAEFSNNPWLIFPDSATVQARLLTRRP